MSEALAMPKTFSQNLRKMMRDRDVTAKVISRETGIAQSTLSDWLNGRDPKLDGVVKIARFFGVSIEFMITGTDPEHQIVSDLIQDMTESFATIHKGVYRFHVEKLIRTPRKNQGDADEE